MPVSKNNAAPADVLPKQMDEPLYQLRPLSERNVPSAPAKETMRRRFKRFLGRMRPSKDGNPTPGDLQSADVAVLDRVAPPPNVGPLVEIIEKYLADWLGEDRPRHWITTIVFPPCEDFGIIETWAKKHDYEIAAAPTVEKILRGDLRTLAELTGSRPLVIPRLEAWFLRHHGGLALVRELLVRLDALQCHCVVGCNSWAWAWLSRAADVSVRLPAPLTPGALDGPQLDRWFRELSARDGESYVVFRRSDNGEPVLSEPDAAPGSASDYLKTLAATSRGIPWVAWHLWRQSLRTQPDDDADDETARKDDTRSCVWVKPLADLNLPEATSDRRSATLLILHALLIHGHLSLDGLRSVLPTVDAFVSLHRLEEDGFVACEEGRYCVLGVSYPAVRDALLHAGYPVDAI